MDRAKRLTSLWSYLPVFRVVAETEHLTLAAKLLSLTPSAVSRSVSALEADLDQALFDRRGRSMKLNEAGRHLLLGIRQSMRVVDESLVAMSGGALVGRVRIATSEPFSSLFAARLVEALREQYPALATVWTRFDAEHVAEALLGGSIDIAFTRAFVPRSQLRAVRLTSLSASAFVGADHPLARKRTLTASTLAGAPYVQVGRGGAAHAASWAAELGLLATIEVDDFDLASSWLKTTGVVGVVPDALAGDDVASGRLVRLPSPPPPDVVLFGITRSPLAQAGPADIVLEAATRIASAEGSPEERAHGR